MGSSLYPSLVGFRGIADTISHEVAADMSLEKVGKDGLPGRVALDGSFQIRGTVFWSPYNKDPTIRGTILGPPILGNSDMAARLLQASWRNLGSAGCTDALKAPEFGMSTVPYQNPQVPCKGVSHSWLRHTADGQNPALP